MTVIYTQEHCPMCDVLKTALKNNNIDFVEEKDVDLMLSLGITKTPMLHVDDQPDLLNLKSALNWIEEKR